MSIEKDLKQFVSIWENYLSLIPGTPYDFNEYLEIINLIKNNNPITKDHVKVFTRLIKEIFFECDEQEIDCCFRIKKYLDTL